MRIVIDLQGAQTESRFRGIGRYSLALTQAIVRNRGKHEIIIALNGLFPETIEPIRSAFNNILSQKNIRVWYTPDCIRESEGKNTFRQEAAELIREAFLLSLKPDIIHVTSLFEGFVDDGVISIGCFDRITPVSISFYDLIPLLLPDKYLKPAPVYEQYYMKKYAYLKRSALLLAISEYTRQEGIDNIGLDKLSIVSVSAAADELFHPLALSKEQVLTIREKYGISHSFILYSGGADERKNLSILIQAYAQLSPELRNQFQLVIAGKIPEIALHKLQKEGNDTGLNTNEIVYTGYVSDEDLVALYNMCELYVFPSLSEGFGLPALEAMSCGTPVICSNTSSLPEVVNNEVALFDPESANSIADKLQQALQDESFRKSLSMKGLIQAQRFSWDASAKLAISSFEEMHFNITKAPSIAASETVRNELVGRVEKVVFDGDFSEQDIVKLAWSIDQCLPVLRQKQLFVDVSELVQRDAKTGVQRVTRSLLCELLRNPPAEYQVRPVYASISQVGYRYANGNDLPFLEGLYKHDSSDIIQALSGDIFLGLDLQHHVVDFQKKYLEMLHHNGVQLYFFVYDLLPIQLPRAFPDGTSENHASWLYTLAHFDGAICISRTVADEFENWVKNNGPERGRPFAINWVHLGADTENSAPTHGMPESAEAVLTALKDKTNFLSVGTIEPRKGYAQTVSAFEQLWANGVDANLVIVGKQGWMVEALTKRLRQHPELGKRLFWLEGISDEYLEKIYAVSTCLITASEGEGFGLPLIEAAQHGLSIIARDIPVFREVAGDHAFYFKGAMPGDLTNSLTNWLKLYETNKYPTSSGMPWLTWKESAGQLLKAIT